MSWWEWVLFVFLAVGVIYTIVPDIILHRLGMGSWKRQYSPGVAITFDDGPDPQYTPKILEVLSRNNMPATFFVVGEKVLLYPELFQSIAAAGHQIGVHSLKHQYAWFQSPWETWRSWDKAVAAVEGITGRPVDWVRPPWGTFNLALWLWIIIRKKKAVLWTSEGHDWKTGLSSEEIARRIARRAREGTIILLHDSCGDEGAPSRVPQVLEILGEKVIKEEKLPVVKLELPAWSMWRHFIFRLWEMWERGYARMNKIERISASNLLRLDKTIYKGPDIMSANGELLAKQGDQAGEIHFDNIRFMGKEKDSTSIALRVLREIKPSLSELAAYIAENPEYADIKIFFGLTLIHRGVKGLGFGVQDVPVTLCTRFIARLQRIILYIYHPTGKERAEHMINTHPKLVWISKEYLLLRWLPR
ncbi:MAG: Peptidoglycan-N-acetylmuramic acid deacetylase PdaC [Candidatus Dichloromethanomonas elyunquensis]|nr:MAG: Peptidoglycan-N-acetylmuramic acid deacetylase PdaC [Candidatus Dichloromethanomonas elyunquensis]